MRCGTSSRSASRCARWRRPELDVSQFAFLRVEWSLVYDAAEGGSYARRALELTVAWAYKSDPALNLPYQENLSALIHDPGSKTAAGDAVFNKARVINQLGNQAVHSQRAVQRLMLWRRFGSCSMSATGWRIEPEAVDKWLFRDRRRSPEGRGGESRARPFRPLARGAGPGSRQGGLRGLPLRRDRAASRLQPLVAPVHRRSPSAARTPSRRMKTTRRRGLTSPPTGSARVAALSSGNGRRVRRPGARWRREGPRSVRSTGPSRRSPPTLRHRRGSPGRPAARAAFPPSARRTR